MRTVNKTEREIADRFFLCLEILAKRRIIRGAQTFTRMHGISYGNFNMVKNHRDKWGVKTEYLAFLAKDFKVSCDWLLLGEGEMFMEGSPALQR